MKTKNTDPQHYLSFSDRGWSLISNGMPLCAPTTRSAAEDVANRYDLKLPPKFWNGKEGKFTDH
jgi:hypothetical protein